MQIFELVGKMAIDGLAKSEKELTDLEAKTQKVQKGLKVMGAAFTAVGAAGLAMIQTTKKMNAQLGVTAANLGVTTKEMRNLALETTNVTFPLDEVLATFDLLARAGVKDQKVLKDTATAFDTLGDATGYSASQVAGVTIPAMKTFNLTAEEMADKTDMLTYMSRKSTMSLDDFGIMVGYTTPELVKQGLTIEELTASIIYMEKQGYAPGRVMTREFMKATTLAAKENISLSAALGMSSDELAIYTAELEGATGMTQEYADIANEQYTLLDKLKQKFSEVTLGMSGFLEPLEPILAGMTALGPIMLIVAMNTKLATIATTAFGVAWKIALGPIGWAIAAIGALTAAGIWMNKNWDKVGHFFSDLWSNIKIIFAHAIKFIVNTVLQPFLLYIGHFLGNIVRGVGKIAGIFNKEWGDAILKVADGMLHLDDTITDWADDMIQTERISKRLADSSRDLAAAEDEATASTSELGAATESTAGSFAGMGDAAEDAAERTAKAMEVARDKAFKAADDINARIKMMNDSILGIGPTMTAMGEMSMDLARVLSYYPKDMIQGFKDMFGADWKRMITTYGTATGEVISAQEVARLRGLGAYTPKHVTPVGEYAQMGAGLGALYGVSQYRPSATGPAGYSTANIVVQLDERTLVEVLGQRLVDDLQIMGVK